MVNMGSPAICVGFEAHKDILPDTSARFKHRRTEMPATKDFLFLGLGGTLMFSSDSETRCLPLITYGTSLLVVGQEQVNSNNASGTALQTTSLDPDHLKENIRRCYDNFVVRQRVASEMAKGVLKSALSWETFTQFGNVMYSAHKETVQMIIGRISGK
eukprot:JP436036.1.p1 GENE.JP436036.1~~JP436036.1.p1  ORF type:complete len:178 (+),score=10.87 JP436036.1:63-536(+)